MNRYDLDLIDRRRMELGWSIHELSQRSGCASYTLYEAQEGRRKLRGRTIKKLCAVLGLKMSDVVVSTDPLDRMARDMARNDAALDAETRLIDHAATARNEDATDAARKQQE